MKPYRRYPPDPPSRRNLWLLAAILAALLLANLAHQSGIA